ncbi:hypothetical protein Cni_G25259 [Canna indica]|uniref:DUF679 domain membrane protein 2 n=1 Tax=Canna indica TaxID=4628 RepID=A0AAQ3L3Z4_9LILI|nr:hypothetical protein Cni_G25259 [Canna indica]
MASSSAIQIAELPQRDSAPLNPSAQQTSAPPANLVDNKTLSTAANLVQLLPTGTVFVFQVLAPSFAHRGTCYAANQYLTVALVAASAVSCAFFAATDSLVGGDGKLYYGVATIGGFRVLNFDGTEEERGEVFGGVDLARYRLRPVDCVHVAFSMLVFLAVAFSDAMIRECLFPEAGPSARELLVNLPLGAGVVSTLVFLVFPTTRRGIGYTTSTPPS